MALPRVLCETNPSGTITAYYVYGLGLISKLEASNAYFYQYDGIGSTVAITDKTGAVKNKYAYDSFGNLATNSTEIVVNPFKYVGRFGVQTDAPDLLYMRARYYNPSIGRFLNKDPIGFAGGLNMYGYASGNPINRIDPFGLSPGVCKINLNEWLISNALRIQYFGESLIGFGLYSSKISMYGITIGIILVPVNSALGISIAGVSYLYGQAADAVTLTGIAVEQLGNYLRGGY